MSDPNTNKQNLTKEQQEVFNRTQTVADASKTNKVPPQDTEVIVNPPSGAGVGVPVDPYTPTPGPVKNYSTVVNGPQLGSVPRVPVHSENTPTSSDEERAKVAGTLRDSRTPENNKTSGSTTTPTPGPKKP